MIDLRTKIPSYCNLTSYDLIINGLRDFLIEKDVTLLSLWVVFFIVFTLSSLIILLKSKYLNISLISISNLFLTSPFFSLYSHRKKRRGIFVS